VRNRIQKHKYKDRKTFLALRAKIQGQGDPNVFRLGGSDIAKVIGVDEYKSTKVFFYECVEFERREDMRRPELHRGVVQEKVIHDAYWRYINPKDPSDDAYLANVYGPAKVFRQGKKANEILINEKYPWLFVSPDYTFPKNKFTKRGVLEIKSPTYRACAKYEAGIATSYVAQTYMQMIVAGFDYGELMALVDCTTISLFVFDTIPPGIKEEIITKSKIFCEKVIEGKKITYNNTLSDLEKQQLLDAICPEEENPELYKEFLKEKHRPENAKASVEGNGEQLQTVISYLMGKEEIKGLTKENIKLENEIREYFHDGIGYIDFGGGNKMSYVDKLNVPARILKSLA